MAKSRFEYVKEFETDDKLLRGCWIVIRLDGKSFTKFSSTHNFEKPCDVRALTLMDNCAKEVMHEFRDIILAYGESDEYSFVFKRSSTMYERRASKLVSLVTSCFTGNYVRQWPEVMAGQELQSTPVFDGRAVLYPSDRHLRDYLSWRQADTHVNNQYNTCFWKLVHSGRTKQEAQSDLKGTLTQQKNELLYSRFGISYGNLPAQFRKGSIVIWQDMPRVMNEANNSEIVRVSRIPTVLHEDLIGSSFWDRHSDILQH